MRKRLPNRDRQRAAAQRNGVDDAALSRSRFGSACSPAASGFWAFRDAGAALAKLHLDYESLDLCPLKWIETPGQPLSYCVEKMKLSKDKKTLVVNDSLALEGIPPEVFDYRLGNCSALDWVIDQYQVSTDKRSGITSDPKPPRRTGLHRLPRRPGRPRLSRNRQDRQLPARNLRRPARRHRARINPNSLRAKS